MGLKENEGNETRKWQAHRVLQDDGGKLVQFQNEIDATKVLCFGSKFVTDAQPSHLQTKRSKKPLKWKEYFFPAANR
jgi:hypothetical protein